MRLRLCANIPSRACARTRVGAPKQTRSCAALVAAIALCACSAPPRIVVDPAQQISQAAQLGLLLEFRHVGPDGGPLDEQALHDTVLTRAMAVQLAVTTDPSLQSALARTRRRRAP